MMCFSTCWNSSRHKDGYEMISEILDLGFNKIELSHGLMMTLVPGINKAYNEGLFEVCGVHNFCPSPVELLTDSPDYYTYTSHKSYDRTRAKQLTIKSIDFAKRYNAKYIVLHMGFILMRKISSDIKKYVKEDKMEYEDYFDLKFKLIKKRQKLGGLYFERARQTLHEIVEHAEKAQVKLAVESRSSYEEVPNEFEMYALMDEFKDNEWIGYWHDFGHVHLKHNLGLINHYEWFKMIRPHLIGCHLHDVVWPDRDHHVPFFGEINYDKLVPLLDEDMPIVWELNKRRNFDDIKKFAGIWAKKYGI